MLIKWRIYKNVTKITEKKHKHTLYLNTRMKEYELVVNQVKETFLSKNYSKYVNTPGNILELIRIHIIESP